MRNRRRNCSKCCCDPCCKSCSPCCESCCGPICESKCCPPQPANIFSQSGNATNLFSNFSPIAGGSDPTSYATFWNTCAATIPVGDNFQFNQAGVGTQDIALINPGTIRVCNSGVYKISYSVNISLPGVPNSTELINKRVSLYVNCMQQPNGQAGFSIQTPDVTSCFPLNADALIFIPANSCISLVNESQCIIGSDIRTCTSGGTTVSISLFRVN